MTYWTQTEKDLQKGIDKEQLSCVKEAWIDEKQEWNIEHFVYCEADLMNARLKQFQADKLEHEKDLQEIMKSINKLDKEISKLLGGEDKNG